MTRLLLLLPLLGLAYGYQCLSYVNDPNQAVSVQCAGSCYSLALVHNGGPMSKGGCDVNGACNGQKIKLNAENLKHYFDIDLPDGANGGSLACCQGDNCNPKIFIGTNTQLYFL